jgi:alpha-beta hydrolase superfamily lysophospholipase
LAEDLAAAGFPVLRFDFGGTGDSSGSERDPGRAEAWLEDVKLAADELRARSGTAEIALVGLRLGATVAAAAAARAGVHTLVVWNPYPSGEAFVRESTKLHRMQTLLDPQGFAAVPRGWTSGGEEALGFLLTDDTIAGLKKIDLFALPEKPAERIFIVGTSNVPSEDRLLAKFRELGAEAEYHHLPAHKFLVQSPHRAELPAQALADVVAWLSARYPVGGASALPRPSPAAPPQRAPSTASAPFEEPVVFGDEHPLFGVLVHPPDDAKAAAAKRPAVLMTNAGCVSRIGPHRFYVPMARRWAALGFWVFRMDLSGIGDSPAVPGAVENLPYPASGVGDIASAMNALEEKTGTNRFIVLGHCSGGDFAFQLGLTDRRIAGAWMLNPRTFCVNDLDHVEEYKRARYYQQALFRKSAWKKALRGDVDFRRALGMLAPKVADQIKQRALGIVGRGGPEGGKRDDVATSLRKIAARGVDTFLLASEKDPGVDYMDERDGAGMKALTRVAGFRRQDFVGIDHTFTSLYAQEKLSQVLTDHLSANHLL